MIAIDIVKRLNTIDQMYCMYISQLNRLLILFPGYNSSLKVGVFNEFATAAFRYGHSQVGNTMSRLDDQWKTLSTVGNLDLRDAYFNPGRVISETGKKVLQMAKLSIMDP